MLGPERARGCSGFHGGFTHEAARAVAGCPLPLLSALVDKSIVAVDHGGRFGLHPVVMVFAAAAGREPSGRRICDAGTLSTLRVTSRGWPGTPSAIREPGRRGVRRVRQRDRGLAMPFELRRCDWIAAMVRALWAYLENRGRQREGHRIVLTPALALADDAPEARLAQARLHHGLSMLHHRIGHHARSLELARNGGQGRRRWRRYGGLDRLPPTPAASGPWVIPEAALERIERGIEIACARNDAQCPAWALGNLGLAPCGAGRFGRGRGQPAGGPGGQPRDGDHYNVTVHPSSIWAAWRGIVTTPPNWRPPCAGTGRCLSTPVATTSTSSHCTLRVSLANVHYLAHQFDEARRHFEDSLLPLAATVTSGSGGDPLGLARLDLAAGD